MLIELGKKNCYRVSSVAVKGSYFPKASGGLVQSLPNGAKVTQQAIKRYCTQ